MIQMQAIGNLGKDAELKTIGGNSYASFSIGVTEKVKGENRTTWLNVMKYDKEGKLTSYLNKGTKVFVSGKPTSSGYENKSGEIISNITIWANELEFLGGSKDRSEQQSVQDNSYEQMQDDLPF